MTGCIVFRAQCAVMRATYSHDLTVPLFRRHSVARLQQTIEAVIRVPPNRDVTVKVRAWHRERHIVRRAIAMGSVISILDDGRYLESASALFRVGARRSALVLRFTSHTIAPAIR